MILGVTRPLQHSSPDTAEVWNLFLGSQRAGGITPIFYHPCTEVSMAKHPRPLARREAMEWVNRGERARSLHSPQSSLHFEPSLCDSSRTSVPG